MVAGRHDAGRRRGATVRHPDGSAGRAVGILRVVVAVAVQLTVTVYLLRKRRPLNKTDRTSHRTLF